MIRATKPFTVVAVLTVTVAAALGAQTSSVPLTGSWAFTVQSSNGPGTPSVTLKQEGEELTGRYSSTMFGEAELRGTVKGSAVVFTVFAKWQGQPQELKFTGDYDGSRSINGTYSTAFGDGTFAATRK